MIAEAMPADEVLAGKGFPCPRERIERINAFVVVLIAHERRRAVEVPGELKEMVVTAGVVETEASRGRTGAARVADKAGVLKKALEVCLTGSSGSVLIAVYRLSLPEGR